MLSIDISVLKHFIEDSEKIAALLIGKGYRYIACIFHTVINSS